MRRALPPKIILLCTCLFANRLCAQLTSADSSLLNTSIATAIKLHNSVLGEKIHLYNGSKNEGYNHVAIGNPYFLSDQVQTGNVFYDDTYYQDVLMLYDLVQDNVVIVQYADEKENISPEYRNILRMNLVKSKIGWFTMPGHEFVLLKADSSSIGMPPGFYERMYNGGTKLFVKRTKVYVEEVKGNELERRFDLRTLFYVQKDGKYYAVRSQKTLFRVLKDKRKDLGSFTRKNKKRFRKNKELLMFETTRYYDQLIIH